MVLSPINASIKQVLGVADSFWYQKQSCLYLERIGYTIKLGIWILERTAVTITYFQYWKVIEKHIRVAWK